MPEDRPIVGFNGTSDRKGRLYAEAIEAAGGRPRHVETATSLEAAARALEGLDGFVMTGGPDVLIRRYGETAAHPETQPMHAERDLTDFNLLTLLLERGVPTLCICLGMQELNVRLGGGLTQHLPDALDEAAVRHRERDGEDADHQVEIVPDTRLATILGRAGRDRVNSAHHQGVLASQVRHPDLAVAASAPDGVVEALEVRGLPFFVGVQWHPERMKNPPLGIKLFEGLVEAARNQGRRAGPADPLARSIGPPGRGSTRSAA